MVPNLRRKKRKPEKGAAASGKDCRWANVMCQWANPADKHTVDPFCKTSSPITITIYTRFKTSSTKTHDLHCFSDFLHKNLTIPLIFSPVSPLCRWTCGESNGHNFPPQRHVFFPSFFTFSTSTTRYLRCFSSSPASKTWYVRCFWHLPTTFLSFFLPIYDHAIYQSYGSIPDHYFA